MIYIMMILARMGSAARPINNAKVYEIYSYLGVI